MVAVRVDGSHKALGFLIWSRIDVTQNLVKGKRLGADKHGLVPFVSKLLQLVPPPKATG